MDTALGCFASPLNVSILIKAYIADLLCQSRGSGRHVMGPIGRRQRCRSHRQPGTKYRCGRQSLGRSVGATERKREFLYAFLS